MISLGSATNYDELDAETLQQIERRLRRFFVRWYREHGRSFPWREPETTPFGILIAEMLLRQTRAEMVASIWPVLLDRYPSPESFSNADEAELLDLLVPLGLVTQRVEATKLVSIEICRRHAGRVPRSIPRLLELPHMGLYSAHAVACFAFNRRVPVVDGNVLRVLSRLTGVDYGRDNRRSPTAWDLAWRILPSRNAKLHNYGLLDFSAQVCKPIGAEHALCPIRAICMNMRGRYT